MAGVKKPAVLLSLLEKVETEKEELHLEEQRPGINQTEVDSRGPEHQHSGPDRRVREKMEEGGGGELQGEESVTSDEEYDMDLELREKEETYDSTEKECYLKACEMLQVVPASYFLHHMQDKELDLMHRGLGPKGTKALAVSLVTNTSILRLKLRDNWTEGMGGAAIAEMLKENHYITEVDLSDNKLGDFGARAISGMLNQNSTLVSLQLSGNHFTDRSAESLSRALTTNTTLQHLDLSHNTLGEHAGRLLGDSLSENVGLRSLSLAWNCIRGEGAVMLASGLGGNGFLRRLDLSRNGLGRGGAVALGEALRENYMLEELNVNDNRIPPEGAIHLAMGLKIGRNPLQSAGCYGILQSVQENPDSAMDTLDFSDITVDQDFEDLYTAVKEIVPELRVKYRGRVVTARKAKP
ncbi:leucine-rich repeat-containing protein 74B isoform X1 [Cololabis saira]|uniref:leucine-rich repeat-containing protein 74B isoform X1 n=1 Tax=Cololabis saira TaxID=129043 RepID=UPI002AD2734C|nr:leucine-rich repeat-containing protein 74B isoform X1 [Cololabis saira]